MTIFISLGLNCSIAWHIKKNFNQNRYPFDWVKCKKFNVIVSSIINCFHQKSIDYLFENLEFVKESDKHTDFEQTYSGKSYIFKNKFFEFFHDFYLDNSNFEEQYLIALQKYKRRFSYLYDTLHSKEHIHFIYLTESNIFDVKSLEKLFNFLLENNILFTFTFLTPKKVNFQHSLFSQIIIQKSFPYDWTYSHLNWNEIFLNSNYRSFISNDFSIPLQKELCQIELIDLYEKIFDWKIKGNYDWKSVKIWLGNENNMIKIVGKEKPRELLNEFDVFYFQEEDKEKCKESIILSKKSFIIQKFDKFYFSLKPDGFTQSNIKISIIMYKYIKLLLDNILFENIIIYGRNCHHIGSFIEKNHLGFSPCNICLFNTNYFNFYDKYEIWREEVKKENNLVIISPGRKGFSTYINNIQSKFIIYISCNQKTLSNDLKLIQYKILNENSFNMFPGTEYTEKVLLLEKI